MSRRFGDRRDDRDLRFGGGLAYTVFVKVFKRKIRRIIAAAGLVIPLLGPSVRTTTAESGVQAGETNVLIEVPVRVYRGNRFVDSLGPDDFEIRENGVIRKIESFDRLGKGGGEAASGTGIFLLCFEMDEAPPGIEKAVAYFFENVPSPGDLVLVQTPRDRWKFTVGAGGKAEGRQRAAELGPRLLDSLRRGREMKSKQIEKLRLMAASGEDEFMTRWRARDVTDEMVKARAINETQYLAFIDYFKALPGRKQILVFYAEEADPIPSLFAEDWRLTVAARRDAFGPERIRTLFADAGLTFHFIFLRGEGKSRLEILPRNSRTIPKGDFFQAYRDLAITTGGIGAAASDPVAAMKLAAAAAETGYLLAFRASSPPDASFKEITVTVEGSGLTVFHRAGYFER
jgi:hypothetical protein